MLAAGGTMWTNSVGRIVRVEDIFTSDYKPYDTKCLDYGWPLPVRHTILDVFDYPEDFRRFLPHPFSPGPIHYWNAAFDAILGLILLAAVWFMCEWWIRSRVKKT
jgi:hypothetical protein